MKRIYFDYNATTPLAPEVLEYLDQFKKKYPYNASSLHHEGRLQKEAIENTRRKLAEILHCSLSEVCFTSGATESNNTVFHSVWENRKPHQKKILITKVEHDAVLSCAEFFKTKGAEVVYIDINQNGEIDLAQFKKELTKETLLVSIMMANNETGIIFPIEELVKLTKKNTEAFFHTDSACAMGKMRISFKDLGIDFLSFSGHKVYSLPACGVLLIKENIPFTPLLLGGGHERGKRAGTENSMSIGSLGFALDFAYQDLEKEKVRLLRLRNRLMERILGFNYPFYLVENSKNQISSTICIGFKDISSQTMVANLDLMGIAVSGGSACQSGSLEPSHVLTAMGFDEKITSSAIRISFGRLTNLQEIEYLAEKLEEIIIRVKAS